LYYWLFYIYSVFYLTSLASIAHKGPWAGLVSLAAKGVKY